MIKLTIETGCLSIKKRLSIWCRSLSDIKMTILYQKHIKIRHKKCSFSAYTSLKKMRRNPAMPYFFVSPKQNKIIFFMSHFNLHLVLLISLSASFPSLAEAPGLFHVLQLQTDLTYQQK